MTFRQNINDKIISGLYAFRYRLTEPFKLKILRKLYLTKYIRFHFLMHLIW